MLYDGDCPLCMREVCLLNLIDLKFVVLDQRRVVLNFLCFNLQVNMLRERNKNYGTIKFVDISSEEYSPDENQGLDYETVSLRNNSFLLVN